MSANDPYETRTAYLIIRERRMSVAGMFRGLGGKLVKLVGDALAVSGVKGYGIGSGIACCNEIS